MNNKVLIASDSTTDLGSELIEKYGIKIVPLGVNLGDKHYIDGVDVDPDMIYAHYEKTGELPKTTAANVADFEDFFRENADNYDGIVLFTISSEMSSTAANAVAAAGGFSNVHVVDTANLSTGGGLLVIKGAEMAEKGASAEEIANACRALRGKVSASFIVDDLEFLHKGGRCSALAAFGANMLQLKPCISVKDGKMGVSKKYRGKFAAVLEKYIEENLADLSDIEPDYIFVTHAGCDEEIYGRCIEQVKSTGYFKNIHLTRAGCTISSHCGRNTLGVLFIRKNDI